MSIVTMNKSGVTHVTHMTVSVNNNNNCNNNNSINQIINNNKLSMNLQSNKMQHFDIITTTTMPATKTKATTTATLNASPPDFDFNIPCRYFKSSFARSLSLNNASNSNNGNNYCRSLDYEQRGGGGGVSNSNKNAAISKNQQCPPLPQRSSRTLTPAAAAIDNPNDGNTKNAVIYDAASSSNNNNNNSNKPPEIPARRLSATANNLEMLQRQPTQQQQQQLQHVPVTQFRPTRIGISHDASSSAHFNKIINQQQQQQQEQQPHLLNHHHVGSIPSNHNSNSSSSSNNTGGGSNRRNCVWPRDNSITGEQDCELSDVDDDDDDDADVQAELTQISSNNFDQQQIQQHQHHQRPSFDLHHEDTVNVEAVLLQNQVDTLQWQLKQVETSCEMYRAVMEEVARFLDRYHSQRQQQLHNRNNTEQIARSKSMYHVSGGGSGGGGGGGVERAETLSRELSMNRSDEAPATYLRARSSTNLIDSKQIPPTTRTMGHKITKLANGSVDDQLYDVIEPANTYSAFKDFTWRRSPKKVNELKALSSAAATEEKLNQEAFRLSRTIHNLLNTSTQQPDLTQHRNSLAGVGLARLSKTPATSSIMTLHHQPLHNSTGITIASTNGGTNSGSDPSTMMTAAKNNNHLNNANATEILFLRSLNMRDSRLSLRSSTDSSVHSTSSSSKVETDEEHHYHHPPTSVVHSAPKPIPQLGSTTEDESGFSSISSFQDIGVPLSSTMISQNGSSAGGSAVKPDASDNPIIASGEAHNSFVGLEFQVDSRNSTLKAPPPASAQMSASQQEANNIVGVPLKATHDMQHRWDSPSKTYRNMPSKFQQRFSALSNDDSATVLWV